MTAAKPPAVILVEPQLGENIGTAARAMGNFALDELRLVAPRDGWPNDKAVAAASGADCVLESTVVHDTFEDAIGDLHFLAATTARPRDMTKPVMTPEQLAIEIVTRTARGERCGILFGREKSGLRNDHVAVANAIVMIPVNPAFASLNIAQAVLLIGYEWLKAAGSAHLGRDPINADPTRTGLHTRASRPATRAELLGFLEHLERELDDSGFLRPAEKRPAMSRNIRAMFERMSATEQEVRTLRGIVASLVRRHLRARDDR
ncbi:MAG: RNA methyltransferase [Pseudomonadota bacterium]